MEDAMKNLHTRELLFPIESIRPWIEKCWTGTDDDAFPRDLIRSWRKNPPGEDPLALLPGVTRIGHGIFSFRFESWDGRRFRVRVESSDLPGWHGFALEPTARGCWITHTIVLDPTFKGRVLWAFVEPIHDWVVEAIFDRLEEALSTGVMPRTTRRKVPWHAGLVVEAIRRMNFPGRGKLAA